MDNDDERKIVTYEKLCIDYKITLPVNQSTGNLQFKSELIEENFNMGVWIERWGEKDGNAFVSKMFDLIVTIKLGFESNCWFVKL